MRLLREELKGVALEFLCGLFGFSRQSFYKREETKDFVRDALETILMDRVRSIRAQAPRLGSHKIYRMLRDLFDGNEGFPGRDAFYEMLRDNGLMLKIKRRHRYRTTNSEHSLRKYPNLIKDIVINRPNQVWVSDITYVETGEGVCYLSLITDAYSRKILGWALGSTLETKYCQEALNMALKTLLEDFNQKLIHHSDRGCQYCSYEYVNQFHNVAIDISMTQSGDPLENALAERVNGILKVEWLYQRQYTTRKACRLDLPEIVKFYNKERPHMSIGYKTPEMAHQECGQQKKCWKNSWDAPKGNSQVSTLKDLVFKKENKEDSKRNLVNIAMTTASGIPPEACQPNPV